MPRKLSIKPPALFMCLGKFFYFNCLPFFSFIIIVKPRPNDRSISTQHIDLVSGNMLRAFGHPVATCWVLKIEQCACPCAAFLHEPGQTNTTSYNIHKCCMKNLTIFKLELTTLNMSQQDGQTRAKCCAQQRHKTEVNEPKQTIKQW